LVLRAGFGAVGKLLPRLIKVDGGSSRYIYTVRDLEKVSCGKAAVHACQDFLVGNVHLHIGVILFAVTEFLGTCSRVPLLLVIDTI
jgi:hypothetical protein